MLPSPALATSSLAAAPAADVHAYPREPLDDGVHVPLVTLNGASLSYSDDDVQSSIRNDYGNAYSSRNNQVGAAEAGGEDPEDADWAELSALEDELSREYELDDLSSSPNHGSIGKRGNSSQHKYGRLPRLDNGAYIGGADEDADDPALRMVKSVVREDDDPSLPNITFRVLTIGTVLCAVGAAVSQLFFFKSNAPSFSSFLIILISYPIGHWMARVLPTRFYSVGPFSFTLNPGPFSVKEHILISVLAGSGSGAAYGADIISIQDLYYHQDIGSLGGILLLLSTQLLGFGLSGLVYKLLVTPSKMVWPAVLVPISLFNTLHGNADSTRLTNLRLRFFQLAFLAVFAWQFLPTTVAPILTSFATICILFPGTKTSATLGSGYSGYGMFNFSLDWSVIGSMGGLYTPFYATVNRYAGLVSMVWFIGPILYFSNVWSAQSYDSPIGPKLYNKNFERFQISSILDPDTLTLDEAKWQDQGPLFLTPYFALTYGTSFAVLSATIVSVLLWHWSDIRSAFSSSSAPDYNSNAQKDIHVEMLEASYEPVPRTWYLAIGISMLLAAIYVVTFYPMQLPIWGLLLSLCIALVFLPACGIIAATTGTVIGLNVITEFIAGLLLPGQPIANVTFKCFGYMVMSQALALVADLKLGLYCKIKPKAMFLCQSYGTALGAIVNYIYVRSVINAKRPYLDGTLTDPTGQWTGRLPEIFFSASVIWGLVGPARFFHGKYKWLYLGFPIGAILPIIPWYLAKKYPRHKKMLSKISMPLFMDGTTLSPQTPTNVIITSFLAAWLSQWYALRKHPKWYEKYNFVLSAGLDAGTSIQALLLYVFGLGTFFEWWGNSSIDTERCKIGS